MRLVDIDDIRVMMFPSEDDDPSESDGEREYRNGWNDALTAINDIQPSAEPETAKRIVGKSRGGMTLWYQCDMCNEPVDTQDHFCRGCGRRLVDE